MKQMPATRQRMWLLLTILLAAVLTVYILSYLVTEPWHALPGLSGDSVKNNFTYLYQIMYGRGFHFDGMHYPYGDNIVYADGQAVLSVPLSYVKGITAGAALSILWWLIGLSYVFCMVYSYKILVHFKVSYPVAMVFGCLIGILSPQLFRISAHYGLSYTCVIPMIFYWTILYHESGLWKYCLYIFFLGLFATFLHPYFSAIVLVWVLAYVAGYAVMVRKPMLQKLRHIWPVLGAMLGVLVTTAIVMKLTDQVNDRPVTPYGLLVYISTIDDVYTSYNSPVWQYFSEHNMFTRLYTHISSSEGNEGYGYIGLTAVIAFLYSILIGVYCLAARKTDRLVVGPNGFSPVWLFVAFAALLFSMGIPYIWHIDWLLDRFAFMKQFRSLGRFSWIFYYIITIYAAVIIYRRFSALVFAGRAIDGYAVLFLAAGLWAVEAKAYAKKIREQTVGGINNYNAFLPKEEEQWGAFLRQHHYDSKDFQGMMMLSLFHVGSDKLWLGELGWNLSRACMASYQTQLPMVNALIARTSWSQTFKIAKMGSGPFAEKPMLHDLRGDKPLLLLRYEEDSLNPDQKYLLDASDYIGHFAQCDAYCFYPARQLANDKKHADSIDKLLPMVSVGDTCIHKSGGYFVDHLDGLHGSGVFFGSGAAPKISGNDSNILMIPVVPVKDSQLYEFSCWFLLSDKDCRSPSVFFESLDSAGNVIATNAMNTKWSTDNDGLWFRASLYFPLRANCRVLRCRIDNTPNPTYKVMDEVLLRPAGSLIISKGADGSVLVNNHLFKKKGGAK